LGHAKMSWFMLPFLKIYGDGLNVTEIYVFTTKTPQPQQYLKF
jgi:hypothetical protein